MTPDPTLTDEELAEMGAEGGRYAFICEAGHRTTTTSSEYPTCTAVVPWPGGEPCGADVDFQVVPYGVAPRLIAGLQASREEVVNLRAELAETAEAFELARSGSWSGWKDMTE